MNRIIPSLVATALAVGLLGACSSSKSAADKVCDARSDLSKAVDTVTSNIKDGNFGTAKDNLSGVSDSYNKLVDAAGQLKSEQAQVLGPQIDALKTSVADLKNVRSLSDLQSGLSSIGSQLQSLYTQITDTLKC